MNHPKLILGGVIALIASLTIVSLGIGTLVAIDDGSAYGFWEAVAAVWAITAVSVAVVAAIFSAIVIAVGIFGEP